MDEKKYYKVEESDLINIAEAIRTRKEDSAKYTVKKMPEAILNITNKIPEGYIKPEGIQTITENGIYDISSKATVDVKVESENYGKKSLLVNYCNPNNYPVTIIVTVQSDTGEEESFEFVLPEYYDTAMESIWFNNFIKLDGYCVRAQNANGCTIYSDPNNYTSDCSYIIWCDEDSPYPMIDLVYW